MDKCFCHLNGIAVKDATARKITDNFVTPEMFGAKGDGTTDDSAAINQALNCGVAVLLRGVYAVGAGMSGNAPEICGMGAKIILLNDVDQVFRLRGTNCFSGLRFNCMNHGAKSCVTISDVEAVEIYDIHIQDVKDMRTDSGSELICAYEIPTVNIHDVHIENCVHKGDGVIANAEGNISGIYVRGYTKQCVLQNITGKEIHNIDDSGNIVFEDSNLIYVHTQEKTAETIIRNIYGYNFGKRLIKTQCAGAVIIDGVNSYSNCHDNLATIGIMHSGHAEQTEHGTAIVSNCVLVSEHEGTTEDQYLFTCDQKALVANCHFATRSKFAVYNHGDIKFMNCTFDGNGILNAGRTLLVDFCEFTVSALAIEMPNGPNTDVSIKNTRVIFDTRYPTNYGSCSFRGKTNIQDTYIKGKYMEFYAGGSIRNLTCEDCGYTAVNVMSGTVTMENIKATNAGSDSIFIRVQTGAKAIVRNIEQTSYTYTLYVNGSADILGGVDLKRVYSAGCEEFTNYPEYISELPNPATMAEGAKAILLSDNKLHTLTSGTWVAT